MKGGRLEILSLAKEGEFTRRPRERTLKKKAGRDQEGPSGPFEKKTARWGKKGAERGGGKKAATISLPDGKCKDFRKPYQQTAQIQDEAKKKTGKWGSISGNLTLVVMDFRERGALIKVGSLGANPKSRRPFPISREGGSTGLHQINRNWQEGGIDPTLLF